MIDSKYRSYVRKIKAKHIFYVVIILQLSLIFTLGFKDNLQTENQKYEKSQVQNVERTNLHTRDIENLDFGLKKNLNITHIGYMYKIPGYRVVTNSQGFRDAEFNKSKPDDAFRIAFVGDSFTFGWGVNRSDIFVQIIEDRLQKSIKDKRVQVYNFAVPGYQPDNERNMIKHRVVEYNPDLVLIGFTMDEDINPVELNEKFREKKQNYVQSLKQKNLSEKQIRVRIERKHAKLITRQLRDENFEHSWERIEKPYRGINNLSRKYDFKVGVFYSDYRRLSNQSEALEKLTKELGWNYIEPAMSQEEYNKYWVSSKDAHINAQGHRRIADLIYKDVAKIVE
jgi:lysophospholipase L1-like esterase